jgi:hypothetical protein
MSREVAAVHARSPEQHDKALQEETRRLELRRRELAHYAAYLRSQRQQLLKDAGGGGSREAELKQQRAQLDQEAAQLRTRAAEQDRAVRVKELELLRERTRLAGERLELHRQREELHRELERARDSAGVRGPLGAVGRRSGQMQACPSGPSS